MQFESEEQDWVHVRNVGGVAFWFQWERKMYIINPNEVAHLPRYVLNYIRGGGCTNYAPNAGTGDNGKTLLQVLDDREGSTEFLKSEAVRKKKLADEAADAARRAQEDAEIAMNAAVGAANVVKQTLAKVREDKKPGEQK